MAKPRLYQNKSITDLIKYRAELQTDVVFCDQKAKELEFGAGAEFYRMRSLEATKELERVAAEMINRGAMQ